MVGSGVGNVTSSPAGIDCGSDCDETYLVGTPVTLTATVDPGSVFDGWVGGGCLGLGDCQITLDSDTTVIALCDVEGGCGHGDAMTLEQMVIDWAQTFEACTSIVAGNGFELESSGAVTLRAGSAVVLDDGVTVDSGASLTIEIDPLLLNP